MAKGALCVELLCRVFRDVNGILITMTIQTLQSIRCIYGVRVSKLRVSNSWEMQNIL